MQFYGVEETLFNDSCSLASGYGTMKCSWVKMPQNAAITFRVNRVKAIQTQVHLPTLSPCLDSFRPSLVHVSILTYEPLE